MAAPSPVIYFTVPGDPETYFARRLGRDFYGMNRWRGFRLLGVQCRRVRPQLVAGDMRIPVRVVAQPAEVAA